MEEPNQDIMHAPRSMLTSSSHKYRKAILALELGLRYGRAPSELKERAQISMHALTKQLRFRHLLHSEEQAENIKSGAARRDKEEALLVLQRLKTCSMPAHIAQTMESSIKALQINLNFLDAHQHTPTGPTRSKRPR